MKYRSEIDGLRAVAVVPVILFHAGFEVFSGGFVGVDVFFVISGYLITSIIISEMEDNRFSLLSFYERRARRILPALLFVILFCIPAAWFLLLPSDMKNFAQSLIAVATFSSNILFWQESGYFHAAAELNPLLHTWSLAIEEQFYILFPLFLMVSWRFGNRTVLSALVLVFAVSLAVAHWGAYNQPSASFYLLPTRAWELLIGSFAAFYLQKNVVSTPHILSNALSALGLAAILFSAFAYDETTPFPSLYALVPTLGTVLIILFALRGTLVHAVLSMKAVVAVGLISYSLYLWHQPFLAFLRHYNPAPPFEQVSIALLMTIVMSILSWWLIEKRFRSASFSREKIFAFSSVGISTLFLLGIFGNYMNGFSGRFEVMPISGDFGQDAFHQAIDDASVDCEPNYLAQSSLRWNGFLRCKQSNPGQADIILLGDSHAEHLFLGLTEAMADKNLAFLVKSELPFLSQPGFKNIFRFLLNESEPARILITHSYHRFVEFEGGASSYKEEFERTIGALMDAGHTIVMLRDIPKFEQSPERCMYRLPFPNPGQCDMAASDFETAVSAQNRVLKQISDHFNIPLLGYDPDVCDGARCSMLRGQELLYRDDNHLNIIGSRLAGMLLANELKDFSD